MAGMMSSDDVFLDKEPKPSSFKAQNLEDAVHLWTADDVANYLRLKPSTVRDMARRGDLPVYKVGRLWRFKPADVRGWVDAQGGN